MTFEELKGEDKEGAFGGWHTVESAKSDGDIPEKFAGYLITCVNAEAKILLSGV